MSSTLFCVGSGLAPYALQRCTAFKVPEWVAYADADLVGGLTSDGVSNIPNTGYGVAFSPDGQWLALSHGFTAGYGGLTIINLGTGTRVVLPGGIITSGCYKGGFSPDSSKFIVGCDNAPYVYGFNTATWATIAIGGVGGTVYSVAFNPAGTLVAMATYGGNELVIRSVSDWSEVIPAGGYPVTTYGRGVAFSADGAKLVFAHDSTPYVTMYDTTTWAMSALPTATLPASNGLGVAYSPDGSLLAVLLFSTPYLRIYDTTTWVPKTLSANPVQRGNDVAFSPDGADLVMTHGLGGTISMTAYTTATGTRSTLPAGVTANVNKYSLAFAPALINRTISTTAANPVNDALGNPAIRMVTANARENGQLLGRTTSAADGSYSIGPFISATDTYVVFADDVAGDQLNDLVIRAKPE
jgi:WD40 repeat protein